MTYRIHAAIFAFLGVMFSYQHHPAAQVPPATIVAYWIVDDIKQRVFIPPKNQIQLKYVQETTTGLWIFTFDQPIDPDLYIVLVTTTGVHGGNTTYAYGIVPKLSANSMEIDAYGREHLVEDPQAPWQTSNTKFTVVMLQAADKIGFSCPMFTRAKPLPEPVSSRDRTSPKA
jgi:hypothetical protein